MKINKIHLSLAMLMTTGISSAAFTCPAFVQNLHTQYLPADIPDLCTAVDRYQTALATLESKGVHPASRIADLHAPRMINPPTWLKLRVSAGFDPWFIYAPAPSTWGEWEVGAALIDQEAAKNFASQKISPLSTDWLLTVHHSALSGLLDTAGEFRTGNEIGRAWNHEMAMTIAQTQALTHIEYQTSSEPKKLLLSWHPTLCIEDRSPEVQTSLARQKTVDLSQWPEVDPSHYYMADDGKTEMQCGYIQYAPPSEVQPQLQLWLSAVNSTATSWGTENSSGDPLLTASMTARWFIAIHPYESGNGRVSRFAMEHLLKGIGLPSPILVNMDYDITSSERQWAIEIGKGIRRAIKIAEHCAADPTRGGCNVVSLTATSAPPTVNALPH